MGSMQKVAIPPKKKEIKRKNELEIKYVRTKDESKFLKLEKDKNEQTVLKHVKLGLP